MLAQSTQSTSTSGYVGAAVIIILSTFFILYLPSLNQNKPLILAALLISTFLIMLTWELLSNSEKIQNHLFGEPIKRLSTSSLYLLRSSLSRYLALLTPWLLMNFLIQQHYYFQTPEFQFSRILFSYITWIIVIGGIPYVYLTLRYRGSQKFEYNDYAILTLLLLRALYYACVKKNFRHILHNRRSRKISLIWLVTLFFLPLMLRFYNIEFSALQIHLIALPNILSKSSSLYQSYAAVYYAFFHMLFVVDVGIAIIAYTVSSRWLNNRVKSVDSTMSGWFVAIICYPPLNSAFTDQFIGYGHFPTQPIFHSEIIQMIIWSIILILFTIYVWATTALGFKFSNLCNRGIVSSGPYRYFRHPAYTCKNLAWWFENSYVLSNPAASLALLAGNIVYILRALTEERHLKQDPAYQKYCSQVTGKFLPQQQHSV